MLLFDERLTPTSMSRAPHDTKVRRHAEQIYLPKPFLALLTWLRKAVPLPFVLFHPLTLKELRSALRCDPVATVSVATAVRRGGRHGIQRV
jgi:hypothetical protein